MMEMNHTKACPAAPHEEHTALDAGLTWATGGLKRLPALLVLSLLLQTFYPDSPALAASGRAGFNRAGPVLDTLDADREDKCVNFKRFPTDTALFREDVAALAGQIIARHGLKEWKIAVLTNEFHEHLGIYSIVGAKMGLRAREYFGAELDEMEIASNAGSKPPLSCMNDGLQVSTGATLGHGTIRIGNENPEPSASFSFGNRVIRISLKQEIRDRIREDVRRTVETCGLETPEYWEHIRKLALQYWLGLSRFDIFDIQEMPSAKSPAE